VFGNLEVTITSGSEDREVATVARKPTSNIPPDRLALYDRLIATSPGIERKGASMPYTSLNGHMFSFLTPTGTLALRLPATDRVAFIERHGAGLHEAHGTVMKEYVSVPDPLLEATDTLRPWFASSVAYVAGLKPKPTRRQGRPAAT
jgi:hypothetical protein